MNVYDSQRQPQMMMVSPNMAPASPGYYSPSETARVVTMHTPTGRGVLSTQTGLPLSPQGSATNAPTLLRTARNVVGRVEVKVYSISGFSDGGLLDTTDPYVSVTYEGKAEVTKVKNNAGGSVEFDEVLSFAKHLHKDVIKVAVCDSNVMRDSNLAEKEIDLSKLPLADWAEFIEAAKPIPFELRDSNGEVAGTVFLGFAACTIQVKVFHIENFPNNAGFNDKTDPYVKLTYNDKVFKTATAANAGGNATYDEIADFQRERDANILRIQVFDSDSVSDDFLGEREIDLTKQYFSETLDGTVWVQAVMLDLIKDGAVAGAVKLAFGKIPNIGQRPGAHEKAKLQVVPPKKFSFSGKMHVKVFKVEGFSESSGMMDKTDPFVRITVGNTTEKTVVKNNAGGNATFDQVLTFQKDREIVSAQLVVLDSDTLSDDVLGNIEIDLTCQVYAEDFSNIRRGKAFDVKSGDQVVGKVYLAFAACIIHCRVHSIEGFSETAGFMDKTDPYVKIKIGTKSFKTDFKKNAGGAATFNETLTFDKPDGETMLSVAVCDRDTVSDDTMGERDIDLSKQYFYPNIESCQPTAIQVFSNGKVTGTVYLSFSKSPKAPGQGFASRPPPPDATTTKWVRGSVARPEEQVLLRTKKPCEAFCCCPFLCCCFNDVPVTRAAVAVEEYPANFREVGYRVDLDGRWDMRNLAGEEIHRLDIKPGDNSLTIGAQVEVTQRVMASPQQGVRTSPMPAAQHYPPQYGSPQMTNSMTQPVYGQPHRHSSPGSWMSPSRGVVGQQGGGGFTPLLRGGI